MWNLREAVELCRLVETVAPVFGCHVALTGGTLYKDGERKDCDILFYRIRQVPHIDTGGLFIALENHGLRVIADHGWCVKARYKGKPVDCFFPDDDGSYPV